MTRLIQTITVALAALVIVASTASALPVRDHQGADSTGVRPQTAHGSASTRAQSDDGGTSPIVYILPTVGLLTILGTATVYVKTSGRHQARA